MAITSKISGKRFPQIGSIGESASFTDYTAAELADADLIAPHFIQSISKEFKIPASFLTDNTIGSFPHTNAATGKATFMVELKADVDAYLDVLFPSLTENYEANIYVLGVKRTSDAGYTVPTAMPAGNYDTAVVVDAVVQDQKSIFVAREDNFYVSVRIDVKLP